MAGAGYFVFTAGQVFTAAQVNTYMNQQSVMVFPSSTTRDTALATVKATGMTAYIASADVAEGFYTYNGTAWRKVSWNAPWGVVAQAASAVASGANAGTVGVLGSPSFTAVANRRYVITISYGGTIQVGAGSSEVQIWRGATKLVTSARNTVAGTVPGCSYAVTDGPSAGSTSYILYTYTNATTVQLQSNYEIVVEDIGPIGSPT
jgi:hypothetical protein